MKRKSKFIIALVILVLFILVIGVTISNSKTSKTNHRTIQVVAGENFWGSLVSQIGGAKVSVISIVSDPNADPHEYESNVANAREFSNANYVILNGAGYDSWGNKLLSSTPNSNRTVLDVAKLLNKKNGDNPHFWYNPDYVNSVINQMELNLANIDPNDASYFQKNLETLQKSLSIYQNRIKNIKQTYGGTNVAATEDIFSYLAQAAGLNLVSPTSFIEAVAEGNDPPTSSVVQFQKQLENSQVKLLVYNEQTVTPLTNNMKKLATKQNIPIIGVTETIQPSNTSFQDWMNNQVIKLQNGLNYMESGQ